jgi:hypothetical protein
MTAAFRSSIVAAAFAFLSTAASAQSPTAPTPATAPDTETRPATTTFFGDTGIWYVPTGEVLGHGKWSASAIGAAGLDQGYTSVADFAGTLSLASRIARRFGSFWSTRGSIATSAPSS